MKRRMEIERYWQRFARVRGLEQARYEAFRLGDSGRSRPTNSSPSWSAVTSAAVPDWRDRTDRQNP